MSARDEQQLQFAQQRFDTEIRKIADRLHSLASDVQSVSATRHNGGRREPLAVANEVLSGILSGVANLRVELLLTWAQDIHEAERQVQP